MIASFSRRFFIFSFVLHVWAVGLCATDGGVEEAKEAAPADVVVEVASPLREAVKKVFSSVWNDATRKAFQKVCDTYCDERTLEVTRKTRARESTAAQEFVRLVEGTDDSSEMVARRRFVGERLAKVYYMVNLIDDHALLVRGGRFVPAPKDEGGLCSNPDITPLLELIEPHKKNEDVLHAVWLEVLKRYDGYALKGALDALEVLGISPGHRHEGKTAEKWYSGEHKKYLRKWVVGTRGKLAGRKVAYKAFSLGNELLSDAGAGAGAGRAVGRGFKAGVDAANAARAAAEGVAGMTAGKLIVDVCVESLKAFGKEVALPAAYYACRYGKEWTDLTGNEAERYQAIAYEFREYVECDFDIRRLAYATRFWSEELLEKYLKKIKQACGDSLRLEDCIRCYQDGWGEIIKVWREDEEVAEQRRNLRNFFTIPATPELSPKKMEICRMTAGITELCGISPSADVHYMIDYARELAHAATAPVLVLDMQALVDRDEKIEEINLSKMLNEAETLPGSIVLLHRIDLLEPYREKYMRLLSELNHRSQRNQCFITTSTDFGVCVCEPPEIGEDREEVRKTVNMAAQIRSIFAGTSGDELIVLLGSIKTAEASDTILKRFCEIINPRSCYLRYGLKKQFVLWLSENLVDMSSEVDKLDTAACIRLVTKTIQDLWLKGECGKKLSEKERVRLALAVGSAYLDKSAGVKSGRNKNALTLFLQVLNITRSGELFRWQEHAYLNIAYMFKYGLVDRGEQHFFPSDEDERRFTEMKDDIDTVYQYSDHELYLYYRNKAEQLRDCWVLDSDGGGNESLKNMYLLMSADDGKSIASSRLRSLAEHSSASGKKPLGHQMRLLNALQKSSRKGVSTEELAAHRTTIGLQYEQGQGVRQDFLEAVHCYERAMQDGCVVGGECCRAHEYLIALSHKLLEVEGEEEALYQSLCALVRATIRERTRPDDWLDQMRATGRVKESFFWQGECLYNRYLWAKDSEGDKEGASELQKAARAAYQESHDLGNVRDALYALGKLYQKTDAGYEYLKQASDLGVIRAAFSLGKWYESDGKCAEAEDQYLKAARTGSIGAQFCYARMCVQKEILPQNYEEVWGWMIQLRDSRDSLTFDAQITVPKVKEILRRLRKMQAK